MSRILKLPSGVIGIRNSDVPDEKTIRIRAGKIEVEPSGEKAIRNEADMPQREGSTILTGKRPARGHDFGPAIETKWVS